MPPAGRFHVPLDVNYYEDARIMDVSPLAELLYVRSLCLAKKLVSDGELSGPQLRRLGADLGDVETLARELLSVGLIERARAPEGERARAPEGERARAPEGVLDGFVTIRSWGRWNATAEDIERISAARAAAGSLGGQRSGNARRAKQVASGDRSKKNEATNIEKRREEESREERARAPRSTTIESDFDECWQHYPRKLARKAALSAYTAQRRKAVPAETLLAATRNFAEQMHRERRPQTRILLGSTFYGPHDRWEDYTQPPGPQIVQTAPEPVQR